MINIMKYILIVMIVILLLMSILALTTIHWHLIELGLTFSFTPKGIDTYISAFGQYKYLFSGTIATCSVYFGLLGLKLSKDANLDKIKKDDFNEWKMILQVSSAEINKDDPLMINKIIKIRRQLFNDLHKLDFNIQNIDQLTAIFNDHIKELVGNFELNNNRWLGMGGIYKNDQHSYSYDSFQFIFFGMIEEHYENIGNDLKNLYIENLPADRHIDNDLYQTAMINYRPIQ